MALIRTFPDAGVLIAAGTGRPPLAELAWRLLSDPTRTLLSSPFLRAEVIPHARRIRSRSELIAYEQFFEGAEAVEDLDAILQVAEREMERTALGLADALHVAAAHLLDADELVTTEGPTKPLYRSRLVSVVPLVR